MKLLKILYVFFFSISFFSISESKAAKISCVDTAAVMELEPNHINHRSATRQIKVDFTDDIKLTKADKAEIRKLISTTENDTTCEFENYKDNQKISKQVNKFTNTLKSPTLKIFFFQWKFYLQ